ncbi:hypothetical protein [Paraferrimonas haliotis]|uniref:Uncharacterized protein n=1 Tax=Paraferrimonas haliotis TaxID=2013866 RepID=A0AA37TK75_9GAMM|nr:hypothetical protein [Paraferrimonas haliotis]GLS82739.1 hypothetical protein GCM10007894_07160 [Paraferrimonas haliotis]
MNEIEQVVTAATSLEAQGKKVTTATVKSQLPFKVSLPAMIEGIKRFQNGTRLNAEPHSAPAKDQQLKAATTDQQIAALEQRVQKLEQDNKALVAMLEQIQTQLKAD